METQSKGNLTIDGIGSNAGGRYDRVVLNGVGTINDNIAADEISINGVGTFRGETSAQRVSVNGTATFRSHVQTQAFNVGGNAKVQGDLEVEILDIDGNLKVEGHVKGDTIDNDGRLVIIGSCEVETFESHGQIKILEGLNAETVHLEIALKCEIKEIGGSQIKVRRILPYATKFLDNIFPTVLYIDQIEGDIVDVEYTDAKTISGHDIFIGEGCIVNQVEYTGTLKQHPSAIVKDARHVV